MDVRVVKWRESIVDEMYISTGEERESTNKKIMSPNKVFDDR